jgi:predicted Zn-dependent protease
MKKNDGTLRYEIGLCVDTDDEHAATAVETAVDGTYPVAVNRYEASVFDGPVDDDEDDPAVDDWAGTLVDADGTIVLTDQPLDLGDEDKNNAVRASKYGSVPRRFTTGHGATPPNRNLRHKLSVLSTAGAERTSDPVGALRVAAVQAVALGLGDNCGYCDVGRCAANCETAADLVESGEFICRECRGYMGHGFDDTDWTPPVPEPGGRYPLTSPVTLYVRPDVSSVAVDAAVAEFEDRFGITPTLADPDPLPGRAYDPDRDQYDLGATFDAIPAGDDIQFLLTDADLFHESRNWVFGAGRGDGKAVLSTHRLRPIEPDDDRFTARVRKQTATMIGRCLKRLCEADCVLAYSSTVTAVDRKPQTACEAC